jgi:hypothetical protein
MHRFLGKLVESFVRRPAGRRPRCRPGVEALEARDVPTVVFSPHFGPEAVVTAPFGMQNPNVYLVFSGSYWTTAQGQTDQAALTASTWSILNGPYLSGLTQYGSDGHANYAGYWNDSGTVPSQPSPFTLAAYLQNSITWHNRMPGINGPRTAPIYVVVSDPSSAAQYTGGWNAPGQYWLATPFLPPIIEDLHMVWVGTRSTGAGTVDRDAFTLILSHELAETIGDTLVNVPPTLPASLIAGNQIGDNEPEPAGQPHYAYRLGGPGGVLVQAYWSQQDNAYIVPDGNTQKFFLAPVWNGTSFTGNYDLTVRGDQIVANDAITVDQDASTQGVKITENGQGVTFEPGRINSVTVGTGYGVNQVSVAALPAGVALNVASFGRNTDTVTIGSGGSLSAVQGTINVSDVFGQTALVIDDAGGGSRWVTITDRSVSFAGLTTITYQGAGYPWGYGYGLVGVTSVSVIDSSAVNYMYVASVSPLTPVSVLANPWDFIYGYAGLVHVQRRFGYITYYVG